MVYQDEQGRDVLVSSGISGSGGQRKYYGTYRRKANGSLQRIKTKFLPFRNSVEEAEFDLAVYAEKKGWNVKETRDASSFRHTSE